MNKIGIIEDTGLIRIRLEKAFHQQGITDLVFLNYGDMLLNGIQNRIRNLDLLIFDLDNHEVKSIELIQQIRSIRSKDKFPLIALSQSNDITLLKSAIRAGCTDFVLKPLQEEQLVLRTLKHLGNNDKEIQVFENLTIEELRQQNNAYNLHWNKDYEIGIPQIDLEHREIVENYEKLYALMKAGVGHSFYNELLLFLSDYVHRHFANEEAFQKEINYPEVLEHQKIHIEFQEKIEEMLKKDSKDNVSNIELIHFNLFLKDWLIHHILMEDRKIGDFLLKIGNDKHKE